MYNIDAEVSFHSLKTAINKLHHGFQLILKEGLVFAHIQQKKK